MIDPLSLAKLVDESADDVVVLRRADAVQVVHDLRLGQAAQETLVNLRSIMNQIIPRDLARL